MLQLEKLLLQEINHIYKSFNLSSPITYDLQPNQGQRLKKRKGYQHSYYINDVTI